MENKDKQPFSDRDERPEPPPNLGGEERPRINGKRHANGHDKSADTKPKWRFPLQQFDEIKLNRSPAYQVRGWLPREGIAVAWGPPKCGKTFLIFDMAMHIALGWKYRGQKVYQGCVVYIACEGERGLAARVEAFRQSHMGDESPKPQFYLLTTRLDLAQEHPKLIGDIDAQLPGIKPAVVVVDTLNRSLVGSESKDEDMGAYIKGADAIREAFNCAVLIIHHCGINAERPRGHTSLAGAVDTQIAVKKEENGTITATVELMKDGAADQVSRSDLKVVELGHDDDGEMITSCVIAPLDAEGDAAPRTKKPIGGAARLALDVLRNCIIQLGRKVHDVDAIPAGVLCVTYDEWRSALEKAEIINRAGNPREQIKRIRVTLGNAGYIAVNSDFVWVVT